MVETDLEIIIEKDTTETDTIIPAGIPQNTFVPPDDRMTLQEIAKILSQNEEEFIDLYDESFEDWKKQADNLCNVAHKSLNKALGENEFLNSDPSKSNYFTSNKEIAATLYDLLNVPERETDRRAKIYSTAYELEPKLKIIDEKSSTYQKHLSELIDLLNAKADIEWYYSKAVNDYNANQNNNMSNVWMEVKLLKSMLGQLPEDFLKWNIIEISTFVPQLLTKMKKVVETTEHALKFMEKEIKP